jgi:hypothetical protein
VGNVSFLNTSVLNQDAAALARQMAQQYTVPEWMTTSSSASVDFHALLSGTGFVPLSPPPPPPPETPRAWLRRRVAEITALAPPRDRA